MNILSLITHLRSIPNLQDLHSSLEHKLRYFWWNIRAFWPCIDSNTTDTFKTQKGSKDIVKCELRGSTLILWILFVCKENKAAHSLQQLICGTVINMRQDWQGREDIVE